jgi:phage shock protein A
VTVALRRRYADHMSDVVHSELLKLRAIAERELAGEWEKRAVLALKAGKEALAREALLRMLEHASTATANEAGSERGDAVEMSVVDATLAALRRALRIRTCAPPSVSGVRAFNGLVDALLTLDAKNDSRN